MKRALTIVALFALAVLAMAAVRPPSEFNLFLQLNGEPSNIGVLTSTGSSVTNATTGTPFTLKGGEVLRIICDAEGWVTPGGTASLTFTSANLGTPIAAKTPFFMVTQPATTTISMISTTGTANCAVWKML